MITIRYKHLIFLYTIKNQYFDELGGTKVPPKPPPFLNKNFYFISKKYLIKTKQINCKINLFQKNIYRVTREGGLGCVAYWFPLHVTK